MWYPPQQQQQQQQQCWNGYIHHLSPQKQQQQQQQQQAYTRTPYLYCNNDDSLSGTTTNYGVTRNDENESLIHYHSTRVDDVYGKKKIFQENKYDLHFNLRLIIYMSAVIYFILQVSLLSN